MNRLTKKAKIVICAVSVAVIIGIVIIVIILGRFSRKQDVYREDMVKRGDLIVGITEEGSVTFGLIEQSFAEDLGFLWRTEFKEDARLVVEQVCVTEGQTIQEGETLYLLEENGVTKLRDELETDFEKAEKELEMLQAQSEAAQTSAQYTYDSSIAYGIYAEEEYNSTIRTLEAAVTDATESLADAKSTLSTCQEQLQIVSSDYTTASRVLKECEKSRDKIDRTGNTYQYVEDFKLAKEAERNLATLEEKKELLEKDVEQAKQNVENYTKQLENAQRVLKTERLNAQETKELRMLAYDMAQETYDATIEYWEETLKRQEAAYAEAKDRWEKFDYYFEGNALKAVDSGVICQVCLAEGDSLDGEDNPVTIYNRNEIAVTAGMGDGEIADISVGTQAEIRFAAFPDSVFRAEVTEISDRKAEQVSGGDGRTSHDVILSLQGNEPELLQGMTGEVRFICKEKADVLYVSNHAVRREGAFAYVTVKDESGNLFEQQVTTGFSDGVNVEILHGLSEKDVVCYAIHEQDDGIEVKKQGRIKTKAGQQLVYAKLDDIKGNEITYTIISTVSGGDAQTLPPPEEGVTALIPVGVISDFAKLMPGVDIVLVIEQVEEESVITAVYLAG